LNDIRELFELRVALEVTAARLAARRADKSAFLALEAELAAVPRLVSNEDPERHAYYELVARFDAAVDRAVGNPYISVALGSVRTHLARARRLAKDNPERLLDAAAEHLLIIRAIIDGDAELAANATHVHLHNSLANVLASAETSLERTA
jgi:DNA-binding GntR family transcriptional regulator